MRGSRDPPPPPTTGEAAGRRELLGTGALIVDQQPSELGATHLCFPDNTPRQGYSGTVAQRDRGRGLPRRPALPGCWGGFCFDITEGHPASLRAQTLSWHQAQAPAEVVPSRSPPPSPLRASIPLQGAGCSGPCWSVMRPLRSGCSGSKDRGHSAHPHPPPQPPGRALGSITGLHPHCL